MKKVLVSVWALTIVVASTAQVKTKVATKPVAVVVKPVFKNLVDSFSYAVGVAVANNLKSQNISGLNTKLMQKAMEDFLNNKPLAMPSDKIQDVLQRQSQIFAKQKEDAAKKQYEPEIAKGRAFLEANKKRKEVITLPDGLQYEVLKKADSATAKPLPTDNVMVNYIGTLIDGKEFDNSYKRGQPATFQVTGVIKGWTEILQLMSVGDKWKVYIPTELAYYLSPRDPNAIPPGAALVFEITLEGINKK